jgi:hypothetical protein
MSQTNFTLVSHTFVPHVVVLMSCCIVLLLAASCPAHGGESARVAGMRASKVWNYPPAYWTNVADTMARGLTNEAAPAAIWIVSFYGDNGNIYATFPSGGNPLPHVTYPAVDYNENYLTEFDRRGTKVWLQVEPGAASMDGLIDAVLTRYKHHTCLAGFGVDVEWLDTQSFPGGRKVTDAEASAWETQVRSYDSTHTLFLKHYSRNRMPAAYRGGIIFVDDSQQFPGYSSFLNEFKAWGQAFSPSKVGFQFGYPDDRPWWSALPNPPATIGDTLLSLVPNAIGVFWVDFTITEVFPLPALAVRHTTPISGGPLLVQNFPNPFNPATIIRFRVPHRTHVTLIVFNTLGQKIQDVLDADTEAGDHDVQFLAGDLAGGAYYYQLRIDGLSETRSMVLVR